MGNLGWPEILIILGIALIIFGPRKLPELGKSLGQSLAQFRRASEDFKRTWEQEVEMEKYKLSPLEDETKSLAQEESIAREEALDRAEPESAAEEPPQVEPAAETAEQPSVAAEQGETVAQEARRDWV